ncbi:MAG: 30S ribosomal protein S13 [Candidatus Omnitrophica bacterium]|nr:30S ribosomal protein S13 [Candidatus Omnitrophota bacterium]
MPRIVGIDIPKEKTIKIALTYIYGIGATFSDRILKRAGIEPNKRAKDLKEEEVSRLATIIQKSYRVEGELKREVSQNVRHLIGIKTYRGLRHRRSLPVRGQRTSTNARTRKGPRKSIGVKKAAKKSTTGKGK